MIELEKRRIIRLSEETANKIAAGEVVDRPVSIVKELVENSIDAGSKTIIVEIKQGGKSYIRVTDDGTGILPEDVEAAFERHATSKIKNAKDLSSVSSLGFRGEALSSIAAVSHTEIITKTKSNRTGTQLLLSGGLVKEKKEIGCTDGTTIIVSDLFYNVPARQKFLKTDAAETNLIIDFLSKIALAFSDIRFRVINNEQIWFSTTGNNDVFKNIVNIYNSKVGENLIHLQSGNDKYDINAYISKPSYTRPSKKNQIFFVNGRIIKSKVLDKIFNHAYKELVPEGRYATGFIFLKILPNLIDVNIHPNKREIKFFNEKDIEDFMEAALLDALRQPVIIPKIQTKSEQKKKEAKNEENIEQVNIKTLLNTNTNFSQSIEDNDYKTIKHAWEKKENFEKKEQIKEIEIENTHTFSIDEFNILGLIFNTYIAADDGECFYLIDQHAAHERVLYEQFLKEMRNQSIFSQRLLSPMVLELSVSDVHYAIENINFIKNLGYEVEEFGNNSLIVKGVPSFLELTEAKLFLDEIIENISGQSLHKNRTEKIISRACKKAVKANDHLNHQEMLHLLKALSLTENPYSCPHGRPVIIKLNESDIDKMFKRT